MKVLVSVVFVENGIRTEMSAPTCYLVNSGGSSATRVQGQYLGNFRFAPNAGRDREPKADAGEVSVIEEF